jgi:nucleotide-binding universal stress UspA family protein
MIRRILCPIDFSPDSRTALAFATSIARRHGAQLILMHVLRDDLASRKSEKEWVVHHALHQLRKLLDRENNLPFETLLEITVGVVPEQISRTATEYHADVVIISVHPAAGTVAREGAERLQNYSLVSMRDSNGSKIPAFNGCFKFFDLGGTLTLLRKIIARGH